MLNKITVISILLLQYGDRIYDDLLLDELYYDNEITPEEMLNTFRRCLEVVVGV